MNELLGEGITAMCTGMGTVFFFLCVLIVSMHIMSYIVAKLNLIFPEAVPQTTGAKKSVSASSDEEIAVAILAAMIKK